MEAVRDEKLQGEGFAVVAIDVGGTKIAGAVLQYAAADEKPTVECKDAVPTLAKEGGAEVLKRIQALVESLKATYGKPVAAVGVATAGRVNKETGAIDFANDIMPGWTGQPVAAAVTESAGVPCAVFNDVQGHALGEARWGAAHGCSNCIMVAPGTGLGGSTVVDGKLVRGSRGFAGEIGHTLHPLAVGIPCSCGGSAHLESVASGSGIEARYKALTGNVLTGAEISARAYESDEIARQVVEEAGFSLGESIATWVNMLDPERVILSGSVCKAGPLWWDALNAGYLAQAPSSDLVVPLVMATLGDEAPLFGAAEHACDSFGLKER